MNQYLYGVVRAAAETFDFPEPIVEVGSYLVEGQERFGLRSLFPGKEYLGTDMRPGPGVDLVANAERLSESVGVGKVGTIIALSVLEHTRHFWKALDQLDEVLADDGFLLLSVPFCFHIHAYPNDYWRWTPEAMKLVLEGYPSRVVGTQGLGKRPTHVWGIGSRHAIEEATFAELQGRIDDYAAEPLRLSTRIRYELGRLICGPRPFEPWLTRSRGTCELISSVATEGEAGCQLDKGEVRSGS
ncbi:hypothetical protein Pan216_04820 [Planctomycetes bacterium Pan216]|uniref:Methyltransferase type 11 domain-containing protein n=1 Tax=Kolteria novifilia TaxID=2527975 RepID=A0A518AY56_9BACT|nr:hypothetical protein Pan216_04820 [Planctomycetes bacterium Pan216]